MKPAITTGPIGATLVRLAVPVIAGEALHVAFHLVDLAWVRSLGAWATAAIATSMFTLWTALDLGNLVGTGLTAHVARAVGEGDRRRAGEVVAQGLWLALGLGVIVAIAGLLGAGALFSALTNDPDVARAGTAYLRVMAVGAPFTFVGMALAAALRACGNTRLPLLVNGAAVVANMGLAPLFVFGIGPFPAWGVMGSAVATLACMACATTALVVLAWRGHEDMPLSRTSLRAPRLGAFLRIARVGAPRAAIGTLFSLVYLWYARLAGMQGAAAIAVVGIGNRLESITYLTGDGFGMATATFVGQNLGAGDKARATRGAWHAVRIMTIVGLGVSAAVLAFPRELLSLLTQDPEAIALGVPYLRVLALCQVGTALEGPIGAAFAGAGDTVPPMVIHVGFALLRFPLASWGAVALGSGLMGVAWTMTATCLVRAGVLTAWFLRGRWKHHDLRWSAAPLPSPEGPGASL